MGLALNASRVFALCTAVGLVASMVVTAMAAPEAAKSQPPIKETIVTPTLQAPPDANGAEAEKKAEENALPFIQIDRKAKEVRIEGVICPRMETLELFACGNGVREHEAIVSVKARPRDINVALIMLGDPPGHAATFTKEGQFLPPYGPVYRVFVEYQVEGKPKRVEAHHWLKDTSTGKTPKPMTWVFAGGEMRKGHFIPDFEGTVVCLSNFQAPILDVPFESSSKNTDLMYSANDAVIPEVGTAVTLILQATGETIGGKKLAWVLAIDKDGSMALEGQKVTMEQLEQKLKDRDQYVQKVQIFIHPEAAGGLMLDAMGVVTKFQLEVELYKKAAVPENLGSGKTDGPKSDEAKTEKKDEPAKDAEGK